MEVHHHSHSSRKKWTHYFWEFFMLFLAVTLGFFVENQREHFIEKKRAKEYARLLADDLNFDIAELNRAERVLNHIITAGDSLALLLSDNDVRKIPGGKLYYYEYWSGWRWSIISRDATLQQLKNSGGLRLIRKHHVADSIAKYDVTVRFLSMQNELEESLINDYRETASNIFDARIFDQMLDSNNNVSKILKEDPKLLAFTQKELQHWNYRMYAMKALNKAIRRDARIFLQQAVNLLNTLEKEYPAK